MPQNPKWRACDGEELDKNMHTKKVHVKGGEKTFLPSLSQLFDILDYGVCRNIKVVEQ